MVRHRAMIPVIVLLLGMVWLRTHHITNLPAYVDEGFHVKRAAIVWDFDQNPGRFAHGKVLLYFWLGLFEADPRVALPVARLAMAILSPVSGATVYLLGRELYGPAAGVVALGLYAVLPLAFFFERMAMADPLASALACLVVWRSLVLARYPTRRQGIVVGLLLGLTMLAKLTLILIPLVSLAAILLVSPRNSWRGWLRIYTPPLLLAVTLIALLWSPLVIPALAARDTAHPFTLVNPDNLRGAKQAVGPIAYMQGMAWLAAEFVSGPVLTLIPAALVVLLGSPQRAQRFLSEKDSTIIVAMWLAAIILVPTAGAELITIRYAMPAAAPLALLLAAGLVRLWQTPRVRWVVRAGLIVAVSAWLLLFVRRFADGALNSPIRLPFNGHHTNALEYISGALSADETVQHAAQMVNDAPPGPVYGSWNLCHLLYFFTTREITCVKNIERDLAGHLAAGDTAYVIVEGGSLIVGDGDGWRRERLALYRHPTATRSVSLWRVALF